MFAVYLLSFCLIQCRAQLIECITLQSNVSGTHDDDTTAISCTLEYPLLISCGFSTYSPTESSLDGGYIENSIPPKCIAQNAIHGHGVFSHARCCKLIDQNINLKCIGKQSIKKSGTGDDNTITTSCHNSTDYLLGCSVHSSYAFTDGVYPNIFTQKLLPSQMPYYGAYNYPESKSCTAQNGVDGGGVKASLSCCSSPNYPLKCITRFGKASTLISAVDCPYGYFMASCSGWNEYKTTNAWYIQNDICYVRSRKSNTNTYSSAICCKFEAEPDIPISTLYVRTTGCDVGVCDAENNEYSSESCVSLSNETTIPSNGVIGDKSTCLTLNYAYQCLLGSYDFGACKNKGYNGSGIIDIGAGVYNFSFEIDSYDARITLKGKGMKFTTLNYNGNGINGALFGCRTTDCYLKISNLHLSSNTINKQWKQLSVLTGGTLELSNVLFDGSYDIQPNNGVSFWTFSGKS
eukprot:126797_1